MYPGRDPASTLNSRADYSKVRMSAAAATTTPVTTTAAASTTAATTATATAAGRDTGSSLNTCANYTRVRVNYNYRLLLSLPLLYNNSYYCHVCSVAAGVRSLHVPVRVDVACACCHVYATRLDGCWVCLPAWMLRRRDPTFERHGNS